MPPEPPTTGLTAAITASPVRSSCVITLTIELEPAGAAGMRSGMAWPKAPNSRLRIRPQVRLRMPTAAGNCGLTTVPSGRMQWNGRVRPKFSTRLGLSE
jgi:hypothetical protein